MPFSKGTRIGKIKLMWMLIINMIRSLVQNREFEWEKSNKKLLEIHLKQKVQKELVFLSRKLNREQS